MSGGPKWCELFLILYRTPYSTTLTVNKTDVVTVCLFRIYTFVSLSLYIYIYIYVFEKLLLICDTRLTTLHY